MMRTLITNTAPELPGNHWVRYGTSMDQALYEPSILDGVDAFVINASSLAHTPTSISKFVDQGLSRKAYCVDPQTHAFQHDLSHIQSRAKTTSGQLKKSIAKLVEKYGYLIAKAIVEDSRPVTPDDFAPLDSSEVKEFTRKVLEFQEKCIEDELRRGERKKYYDYLEKKDAGSAELRPFLLTAPYFYLTSKTLAAWLPINCELVGVAKKLKKGSRIAAQIVISKDILEHSDSTNRILEHYKAVQPDLIHLWVDSFDEQEVSQEQLESYCEFVTGLCSLARTTNLYGGFFTTMLSTSGKIPNLAAVCHGPEYGESRPVKPVGGGIPSAKYYLRPIHRRLLVRDALRALRALGYLETTERYFAEACKCGECKSIFSADPESDFEEGFTRTEPSESGREFPTLATRRHCGKHYLHAKNEEFRTEKSAEIVAMELEEAYARLKKTLSYDELGHCEVWKNTIALL